MVDSATGSVRPLGSYVREAFTSLGASSPTPPPPTTVPAGSCFDDARVIEGPGVSAASPSVMVAACGERVVDGDRYPSADFSETVSAAGKGELPSRVGLPAAEQVDAVAEEGAAAESTDTAADEFSSSCLSLSSPALPPAPARCCSRTPSELEAVVGAADVDHFPRSLAPGQSSSRASAAYAHL